MAARNNIAIIAGQCGHERVDRWAQPAPERRPCGAVPGGNKLRRHPSGARKVASGIEQAVVDDERADNPRAAAHPTSQWRPDRAVPVCNVVGSRRPGGSEIAGGDQVALINRQCVHNFLSSAKAATERGPCASVPGSNVVGGHAPGAREVTPSNEIAVVNGEGVDVCASSRNHAASQRRPLRTVPDSDVICRACASGCKVPTTDQVAVVVDERVDLATGTIGHRRPHGSVPKRNMVVRRHAVGGCKGTAGNQSCHLVTQRPCPALGAGADTAARETRSAYAVDTSGTGRTARAKVTQGALVAVRAGPPCAARAVAREAWKADAVGARRARRAARAKTRRAYVAVGA